DQRESTRAPVDLRRRHALEDDGAERDPEDGQASLAHPGTLDPLGVADSLRREDRKSTRLNSSHVKISYAVFCLKKKNGLRHVKNSKPVSPINMHALRSLKIHHRPSSQNSNYVY